MPLGGRRPWITELVEVVEADGDGILLFEGIKPLTFVNAIDERTHKQIKVIKTNIEILVMIDQ